MAAAPISPHRLALRRSFSISRAQSRLLTALVMRRASGLADSAASETARPAWTAPAWLSRQKERRRSRRSSPDSGSKRKTARPPRAAPMVNRFIDLHLQSGLLVSGLVATAGL